MGQSNSLNWLSYYNTIRLKHPITAQALAEGMQVSLMTINNFKKKPPAKREQVIMLAAMMGLSIDETDELLQKANYSRLYALNVEDITWMYLLNKGCKNHPKEVFQMYMNGYCQNYGEEHRGKKNSENKAHIVNTEFAKLLVDESFERSKSKEAAGLERLKSIEGIDKEYMELISELAFSFNYGNRKLIRYIKLLFEDYDNATPNEILGKYPRFLNRYYDNMRALVYDHKIPSREFLIALGVYLNLGEIEMNELFHYAGMSKLNINSAAEKYIFQCMKKAEEEDIELSACIQFDISKLRKSNDISIKSLMKQLDV